MIDKSQFSRKILDGPEGTSDEALARIAIAKRRIQSILDRDTACCQKTLEQKIAEQGPREMRVDPHLIGRAILDLTELNRLVAHRHATTGALSWYANPGRPSFEIIARLDQVASLYDQVSGHGFGNLTGDALELVTWKALRDYHAKNRRYTYQGHFDLTVPKNAHSRYRRIQPPKAMGEFSTLKEADVPRIIRCGSRAR
jgi:hypothetical protein